MSIIQEALEKARSDVEPGFPFPGNAQMERPEKIGPSVEPALRKPSRFRAPDRKVLIRAALSVLVIVALFLAGIFLSMIGNRIKPTSAKNAQEVSYRPIIRDTAKDLAGTADRFNTSPERIKKVSAPELVLNGIMYVKGQPRAIINNYIVEEGDSVLGALVTGIRRESVILEHENVEITLSLK